MKIILRWGLFYIFYILICVQLYSQQSDSTAHVYWHFSDMAMGIFSLPRLTVLGMLEMVTGEDDLSRKITEDTEEESFIYTRDFIVRFVEIWII